MPTWGIKCEQNWNTEMQILEISENIYGKMVKIF